MTRIENKQHQTGTPISAADAAQSSQRIIGSSAGIDGSSWQLELHTSSTLVAKARQIEDLANRCRTPNPFFGPAFLAPAIEHLASSKIQLLTLYEITGQHRELKAFLPASSKKVGLRRNRVLRIWSHPFAPLSSPLVDASEFARTMTEFANCILAASANDYSALLFQNLPKATPFAEVLHGFPQLSDRLVRHSVISRASISGTNGLLRATDLSSGKRKQRMNKAWEHLAALGRLEFRQTNTVDTAQAVLDDHLLLEDRCWKGKKGTSILSDSSATSFVKSAVANLIKKGDCTIHTLCLNDQAIASMIMLNKSGYYYPWKIAFDETYAKFSIGNLLTVHVNGLLSQDSGFSSLDSLASDLNQTARRFWPDELELCDMTIGLGPAGSKIALQISAELDFLSRNKRTLKKVLGRSL